jgi:hypothetical protein
MRDGEQSVAVQKSDRWMPLIVGAVLSFIAVMPNFILLLNSDSPAVRVTQCLIYPIPLTMLCAFGGQGLGGTLYFATLFGQWALYGWILSIPLARKERAIAVRWVIGVHLVAILPAYLLCAH